jgi:hypothetical protein
MSEQQADYITEALELIGVVEPRQIITEISGFIPVFEVVLEHYKDPITALVFGRMWQYCGMTDGVCRASLEKIGNDIGMSPATVMRHAEKLVNDGYLIDTTPDRRNSPHEYLDGRRVEMKGRISGGIAERRPTVSQRNATVSESQLIKQDNTRLNDNVPKSDLVDFELSKLPAKSIRQAVQEYFRLRTDWEKNKYARQWMEWAVGEKITAEQIRAAAETWRTDKKFNWQPPSLKGIFEKWDMLMDAAAGDQTPPPAYHMPAKLEEDESQFVPAPRKK